MSWSGRLHLDPAVVQGFYDRMRLVAPSGAGAIERDRARGVDRSFRTTACGRLVESLDADGVRALGMWVHHWAIRFYDTDTAIAEWLALEIGSRRGLGWTVEEVLWMFGEIREQLPPSSHAFDLPVAAARQLPGEDLPKLGPEIEAMVAYVTTAGMAISPLERGEIRAKLRSVLHPLEPSVDALPTWLLSDTDDLGPTLRQRHGDLLRQPGVAALCEHAHSLSRVEPSGRWRKQGQALLAETPDVLSVVRAVFEIFVGLGEPRGADPGQLVLLEERNENLLRGLVWLLADVDQEWVTPLLAEVTRHAATAFRNAPGYPHCPRLANAAVVALSRRTGELPVRTLARLSLTVKNKALASRVRTALSELGALRGWSPEEVAEQTVPDHGLDADARRIIPVGGYEAVVRIDQGRAVLEFRRDGRPLKGVPALVRADHPDELAELRHLVKGINATLAAERTRIEGLFSTDRSWAPGNWTARYPDHPVTGAIARELLWQTEQAPGEWVTGCPHRMDDGQWMLRLHDPYAEPPGPWRIQYAIGVVPLQRAVRLWHPVLASVDEVRGWRDEAVAVGWRQPIKQVFREIYLLTPAEETTRHHSDRFAGHILRYRQANALMRTRGWTANYLGPWDGGHDGVAVRELGGGGWRVSFHHDLVDTYSHALTDPFDHASHEAQYCTSGQVRFERRDGAVWQPMPVTEVPPLVLSEGMRDVDLFVGVTSIAADPHWPERGDDRFGAYWAAASAGPLTALAEVRGEALARLLPRTRIADRVELDGRFLRVRGNLRTYKIHLGSGNVLMEPNDAYLCIVADRRAPSAPLLPYEGDQLLSVILSKAFLLAADDRIDDETILAQLAA